MNKDKEIYCIKGKPYIQFSDGLYQKRLDELKIKDQLIFKQLLREQKLKRLIEDEKG